ncbi:NADH-quinone oxidoreductase subunit NuoE [Geminicoccus roseus]|uniref:NADH-quinone oxidoreductase subunit NuoE n=1 Tax=Geminicoccus roseus TaxID=404900 RepID=UPI000427A768|nr:NADH-quinone oxidoreductase subunit NuoE [Geminicoccus roseus]
MSGPSLVTRPYGAMAPEIDSFAFSEANQAVVKDILAKYPEARRQSATLPLLMLAQEQHGGWLPKAAMDHVADLLGVARIRIYEVATFYDMYNTTPVGPVQVRVCTTTPCWLCGSDDIVRAAKDELQCDIGESSPDGRFFLREFECLGACANAPVLWVDEDFYEDLDYDKTRALLAAMKRGEAPTPGPQNGRQASMPIGGKTTLFETAKPAPAEGRAASEEAGS